jgi:hypothetical protein
VCTNQQNTCPAPYATCPAGTTTPVTPALQNLCSDLDLDAIQGACAGGADTGTCIAALQVLNAASPACGACLAPFAVPFESLSGIYRCVAPQANAQCNRFTACAVDCTDKSCTQCTPANQPQCRDDVRNPGGQCFTFVQQTSCVLPFLQGGQLCSPFGGDYGSWLRRVGDHFCGNGP